MSILLRDIEAIAWTIDDQSRLWALGGAVEIENAVIDIDGRKNVV